MSSDIQKHITASAVATCIAEIATLPLCTLKTNYQNTDTVSIPKTITNIWNKHGLKGFYNASLWAISSQVLATTLKYTGYRKLKEILPSNFAAGALSGFFASIITHPVDVIKIRYQMHTPFFPELKTRGPSLFYRGYSKTFGKSLVGSTLFYPLYDFFHSYTNNPLTASLGSAIISTTVMQPLDYMKVRQTYGLPFFTGWNPKPYFKGLKLNLLRVIPHFMITMTLIDYIEKK